MAVRCGEAAWTPMEPAMSVGSGASPARLVLYVGLCFGVSLLAGCHETTSSLREPIKTAANAPVRNPNASPHGASVALNLTGIENVPPAVVSRFSEALAHAADTRGVEVVAPKL